MGLILITTPIRLNSTSVSAILFHLENIKENKMKIMTGVVLLVGIVVLPLHASNRGVNPGGMAKIKVEQLASLSDLKARFEDAKKDSTLCDGLILVTMATVNVFIQKYPEHTLDFSDALGALRKVHEYMVTYDIPSAELGKALQAMYNALNGISVGLQEISLK